MTTPELERLIAAYLENRLSPQDEAALLDQLKADPRVADELARLLSLDEGLREALSPEASEEALARAVADRLAGKGKTERFAALVVNQLKSNEPAPRPRTRRSLRRPGTELNPAAWIIAAVAAAVLLVAIVSSIQSPPDSAPRRREEPQNARTKTDSEIAEIERKRQGSAHVLPLPPKDPADDEKPKKEIRKGPEEIERNIREEVAKKPQTPPPAAPPQETPVPPPQEKPSSKPEILTQVAVAQIVDVVGDVSVLGREGRTPAKAGVDLLASQGLQTGASAKIAILFPDKTRVELGADTILDSVAVDSGKRFGLTKGLLYAVVSPQPKDKPMIVVAPQGTSTVVGTTLRIVVDPDPKKGTRLDVVEGKVDFKDLAGKTVRVESGHYAVAAVGTETILRTLPIEEILLTAKDAKREGGDWRVVKDDKAATGSALECPTVMNRFGQVLALEQLATRLTFTFTADADRDYGVWVRGACTAAEAREFHDCVVVQFPGGKVTKPPAADRELIYRGSDRSPINGYGARNGYWWIGGNADPVDAKGELLPLGSPEAVALGDAAPITVRFSRPGVQTLRIYAMETPMRIDAVWMSSSQKTRPDDATLGPGNRGK